ncbi:SDR family NAD(P)-dependent oxidoreductase [Staphylococcus equorum]|uniref:SDR family NAD(P)-dependent oxidoreductase n=1 Tax=Staphylococcus equorum TaxID=246432 RepID=UPI003D807BDA
MRVTLITGGNKGLGYETARRLKERGHKIYIGSRSEERGEKAAKKLNVDHIQLDVTDEKSVKNAAQALLEKEGKVDVLINNAGVSNVFKSPKDTTAEDIEQLYNTNVFGVVRMMNHFIPLLEKSKQPVVVNVSSGLGSFGMVSNLNKEESKVNALAYSSSKSAVTMLTVQYAKALVDMQINAADPGSTNTDLVGDFSNNAKSVKKGTDAIVELATIDENGPTGTFINNEGTMPW